MNFLYWILPFKRQLFTLLKNLWIPPESVYRHLYFDDWFWVKVGSDRKFKLYNGTIIENEIFWNGLTEKWEKESIKLWIKLSERSRCILDIGANNGVYALVAKSISPDSLVYAFEPHPLFYKGLKRNVELNHFSIRALNYAVSSVDEEISIQDYTGNFKSIEVQAITLKRFIESNNISLVDLIKIDVETFEPEVLEGFGSYLYAFKPTLIIEILNQSVADQVTQLVEGVGYLMFDINEENGLTRVQKITPSTSFNYLLITEAALLKIEI